MYVVERAIRDDFLADAKARGMLALVRVKPGADMQQVQSEMAVVGQRLLKQYPRDRGIGDLRANPLRPRESFRGVRILSPNWQLCS